ncbi:MAG: NifB/NifX family molybdenum-iron cluster-binding protein [Candidatus Kariarchaeaceae archaeon]
MKAIVALTENKKTGTLSGRFGRAPYHALVDLETGEIEIFNNEFANEPHGVGTRVANWCIRNGAKVAIADTLGPKVADVLAAAGFELYSSGGLQVEDVVEAYKNKTLPAYGGGYGGMGAGQGAGQGTGQGRGQGRGRN